MHAIQKSSISFERWSTSRLILLRFKWETKTLV
jgi:hypothetical protein